MGHRLRQLITAGGARVRGTAPMDRRLIGVAIAAAACVALSASLLAFAPATASQEEYAVWFSLGLGSWLFTGLLAMSTAYYAIRAGGRWRLLVPVAVIASATIVFATSTAITPPQVTSPPLPALPRQR